MFLDLSICKSIAGDIINISTIDKIIAMILQNRIRIQEIGENKMEVTFTRISIYLSIYLSIYISIYLYPYLSRGRGGRMKIMGGWI